MQKVVILARDGTSSLPLGDNDRERLTRQGAGSRTVNYVGQALPALLSDGWRVTMLTSPGPDGTALVLVEKDG